MANVKAFWCIKKKFLLKIAQLSCLSGNAKCHTCLVLLEFIFFRYQSCVRYAVHILAQMCSMPSFSWQNKCPSCYVLSYQKVTDKQPPVVKHTFAVLGAFFVGLFQQRNVPQTAFTGEIAKFVSHESLSLFQVK